MASPDRQINVYALNLRRLMARSGVTMVQVVDATGLSERTVKGILSGRTKPHARTLNRLALGLGFSPDEFFQAVATETARRTEQAARGDIHEKVDRLLANGYREILTGMIELLCRQSSEPSIERTVKREIRDAK